MMLQMGLLSCLWCTNMNDASSRSHYFDCNLSNNTTLYMIDLAGSERNKRWGDGDVLMKRLR